MKTKLANIENLSGLVVGFEMIDAGVVTQEHFADPRHTLSQEEAEGTDSTNVKGKSGDQFEMAPGIPVRKG